MRGKKRTSRWYLRECGSGEVKAKGMVDGVVAGCFPQLYKALGPNAPDQVITL